MIGAMETNEIKKGYVKLLGKLVKVGSKKHQRMLEEIRVWNQTPFNER